MFQNFRISEESWGNIALKNREYIDLVLEERNALAKLKKINSKKLKQFRVVREEEISIKRASKPILVNAPDRDNVLQGLNAESFEFINRDLFTETKDFLGDKAQISVTHRVYNAV